MDLSQTDVEEKGKGRQQRPDRLSVTYGGELRFCCDGRIMTGTRAQQLEELLGTEIYNKHKENFLAKYKIWKKHKDEHGNCVHPDKVIMSWLWRLKDRYKKQLRKQHGLIGKRSTLQKDPEADKGKKAKTVAQGFSDLDPWQIKMMSDAGFCWWIGRSNTCFCDRPNKKTTMLTNWWKRDCINLDEAIAAMKQRRKKTGDCIHPDTSITPGDKPRELYEDSWNAWIEKLTAYKATHGHCKVRNEEDTQLYTWLCTAKRVHMLFQRAKERKRNNTENDEGAEMDLSQTDVEEKGKGRQQRPDRLSVTYGGELRFCCDGRIMTGTRAQQLEELLGTEIYNKHKENFLAKYKIWKKHKDEHGNCVHPDKVIMSWLWRLKDRYKKQLRKQHGLIGKRSTLQKDPEADKGKKAKTVAQGFSDLDPWQIKMMSDAGFCWWIGRSNTCFCDRPNKKAAMLTNWWKCDRPEKKKAILTNWSNSGCINLDEAITAMKQHQEETGHCVHPDTSMHNFFRTIKARRLATLEKREQEACMGLAKHDEVFPKGGSGDDKKVEADEAVSDRGGGGSTRRKKVMLTLLSDEDMLKLEGLDICWGGDCTCLKKNTQGDGPNTSSQLHASVQGNSKAQGDGNVPVSDSDGSPFYQMLALFVEHRKLCGRCYTIDTPVQKWYEDVQQRFSNGTTSDRALTNEERVALLKSGICLRPGPCMCQQRAFEGTSAAKLVHVRCPPSTAMTPGVFSKETDLGGISAAPLGLRAPLSKTVAQLNSEELLELSTEVVNEVRKLECWSSDECSSDSDESSDGDDSSNC